MGIEKRASREKEGLVACHG